MEMIFSSDAFKQTNAIVFKFNAVCDTNIDRAQHVVFVIYNPFFYLFSQKWYRETKDKLTDTFKFTAGLIYRDKPPFTHNIDYHFPGKGKNPPHLKTLTDVLASARDRTH